MNDTRKTLLNSVLSIVNKLENKKTDIVEWVDEQLSIESICFDTEDNLNGVEILCAFGGPDIRVYCGRYNYVEGHWGSDTISRTFDDNRLFEYMEELYSRE